MEESISGTPAFGQAPAPKGRRFASDIIDLVLIPLVLGFVVGLLLLNVSEIGRNAILVVVNIFWLVFRDMVYSPGRAMVGLKLMSLNSEKVSLAQAFIRNVLLIIPFVLILGYLVEIISLIVKGERVEDGWAKTRVVAA